MSIEDEMRLLRASVDRLNVTMSRIVRLPSEVLPVPEETLTLDVEVLGLSVRAANGLQNARVSTIADLLGKTENDLLKVNNFGRKCLREVVEALAKRQLKLRERW